MAATVTMRDETPGQAFREWTLEVLSARMTVRERTRSRVYEEVQDYNRRELGDFQGLVQPTDAIRVPTGFRQKNRRPIDWQQQYDAAIAAFDRNQILVLVNDRQAESLDEE